MTPHLTIAIPTFNRNKQLRANVANLIPQLTPAVCLTILDNASTMPVRDDISDLLATNPNVNIEIVRHPINIGAAANVLRCLEICVTPWIWILGDDDRPVANAVQTALATIEAHADCELISCNGMRDAVSSCLTTNGINEFIDSIPDFGNLTLISDNLVRADHLAAYVRLGSYYAYSLYPVLACLFARLIAEGGKCCFVPERLIEWEPLSEWSRILAAAGMGTLLDLSFERRQRKRLARMLIESAGKFSSLAVKLMDQIDVSITAETARYLYSQAWYRLFHHQRPPSKYLVRAIGTTMLTFPTLARAIYRRYRWIRGYPESPEPRDEMRRT